RPVTSHGDPCGPLERHAIRGALGHQRGGYTGAPWRYNLARQNGGARGDSRIRVGMKRTTLSLAYLFLGALSAGLLTSAPLRVGAAVRELPADIERLYNGGLYRQAAEELNVAIQREPQESSLHYWLGRCFYELRDYNRAISSLERAIALE